MSDMRGDEKVLWEMFLKLGMPMRMSLYTLADGIPRVALFLVHEDEELTEFDFIRETGELTEIHAKQEGIEACHCGEKDHR